MKMIITRAAHQLPRSFIRTPHLSHYPLSLSIRQYVVQHIARKSTIAPSTPATSNVFNEPTGKERAFGASQTGAASQASPETNTEISDLIRHMIPPRRKFRSRFNSADEVAAELDRQSANPMARRQGQILERMSGGQSLDRDVLEIGRRPSVLPPLNPPVRCDAYIARSEPVGRGVTLSRALEKLNIKLAINRVRYDLNKQRFHERPGLRRKRLKRERWRYRFKKGFVATVQKVQKMAKKGW